MGEQVFHPAPAAGASPPPPPLPHVALLRDQGRRVGEAYGAFREWVENYCDKFETKWGGRSLWENLSTQQRLEMLSVVERAYASLPVLPVGTTPEDDKVIRDSFIAAAHASYELERFLTRAVWASCELLKIVVTEAAPNVRMTAIGSSFSLRWRDCAAHTASRVLKAKGVEMDVEALIRRYWLPKGTLTGGFKVAVGHTREWFEEAGIKLAETGGGLHPVAQGGKVGNYVVFLEGGPTGGHVIYGEVTEDALLLFDGQNGRSWTSVKLAERGLGMEVKYAFRVESVTF